MRRESTTTRARATFSTSPRSLLSRTLSLTPVPGSALSSSVPKARDTPVASTSLVNSQPPTLLCSELEARERADPRPSVAVRTRFLSRGCPFRRAWRRAHSPGPGEANLLGGSPESSAGGVGADEGRRPRACPPPLLCLRPLAVSFELFSASCQVRSLEHL